MANWLQRLKSLACLPCHKICAKLCDSLPQDKLGLIAIAAQIEMYLGSFGFSGFEEPENFPLHVGAIDWRQIIRKSRFSMTPARIAV